MNETDFKKIQPNLTPWLAVNQSRDAQLSASTQWLPLELHLLSGAEGQPVWEIGLH